MRFFFADSQDLVDPSFDFVRETRADTRLRHRDDLYAHELFETPPYDGILVSKAIVDGTSASAGKYTIAQRHRLHRCGVREFFRLGLREATTRLETMGDCGAFSYVREPTPPFSVDEVLEFYANCGFDYGVAVDHVILAYAPEADADPARVPAGARDRQALTLGLAREFLKKHKSAGHSFVPVGVAQGWSPKSYALAVKELQKIGYRYIALGGMVPLKSEQIADCLAAISAQRRKETQLHLFGVTRCDRITEFGDLGVASFDSTSALRQAFKDDKDNYHTLKRPYTAIRVPQVEANPKLQRLIQAGKVDHDDARRLEQECLKALLAFDVGRAQTSKVVRRLHEYEQLHDGRVDHREIYREVLEAAPWKRCRCDVCRRIGIHVILFRGADRNRRRGFHNLHVLWQRLNSNTGKKAARQPRSAARAS